MNIFLSENFAAKWLNREFVYNCMYPNSVNYMILVPYVGLLLY